MAFVHDEINVRDPEALADWIRTASGILNGGVSFGDPTHPVSASQFPNGTTDNMRGSWIIVEFEALDTATSCAHNLDLPTTGTATNTKPNVVWRVVGMKHDGNSVADGREPVSVQFEEGDTIGASAIELRAYAAGSRVVDGDHPLTVVLWFEPATPW